MANRIRREHLRLDAYLYPEEIPQRAKIRNPFISLCAGRKERKILKHRRKISRETRDRCKVRSHPLHGFIFRLTNVHSTPPVCRPVRRNDISNIKTDDGFQQASRRRRRRGRHLKSRRNLRISPFVRVFVSRLISEKRKRRDDGKPSPLFGFWKHDRKTASRFLSPASPLVSPHFPWPV